MYVSANSKHAAAAISLESSSKVYYTGGFSYYTYDSADRLIDLATCEVKESGVSELVSGYELYKDSMEANLINSKSENSGILRTASLENYTVTGFYTAQSYMKTMSYFSGYSSHCSPTAATKMDSDIPVHLSVNSYSGGDNHSVNVWGYSVVDSTNYLRITDNWGSSVSNSLINYSSYSYGQYVYYGLN